MTRAAAPARLLLWCLFGLTGTVLAACTLPSDGLDGGDASKTRTGNERGTLDWAGCAEDQLDGLECATLLVPLDPADPDGGRIELALTRLPAGGDEAPTGSLVVNPGGPGASGVELVAQLAAVMDPAVLSRFDLVGFDPRGVGRSTPVACIDDKASLNALDGDPDTAAEIAALVDAQERITAACIERHASLLPHLSTINVAHDLDRIRAALGDERLTYLGFSYGTQIGAAYAALYPDHVRAMVLDGAVAPDLDDDELAVAQGQGFDHAFASFVDACRDDTRCAAGPDARARYEAARRAAEAGPVAVSGDGSSRKLSTGDFQYGVVGGLYDQALWRYLAQGLDDAAAGDGAWLLALADIYHERRADGTYPNSDDANLATSCADSTGRHDAVHAEAAATTFAGEAPLVGALLGWSTMACNGWPLGASPWPATVSTTTTAPILVVGTVNDPATPYVWALRLTDALAPAARLLTWFGEGHTAYLKSGCVTAAVDALLVDLTEPGPDARCPADADARDNAFRGIAPDLSDGFVDNSGVSRAVADCIADRVAAGIGPWDLVALYQGELPAAVQSSVDAATGACLRAG